MKEIQYGLILEKEELKTIIHALIEGRDKVKKAEGDRYGEMTMGELNVFIEELQEYQRERGR